MKTRILVLSIFVNFSTCKDFQVGMFKKKDILVAQDTLYKEASPFGYTTAHYGRMFPCPITYIKVVDRLGEGRPPRVQITRGGVQKKYITLILRAFYRQPIAVNIYVGCENKIKMLALNSQLQKQPLLETVGATTTVGSVAGVTEATTAGGNTTVAGAPAAAGGDTPPGGDTPAAPAGGDAPPAPGGDAPPAPGGDAPPAPGGDTAAETTTGAPS